MINCIKLETMSEINTTFRSTSNPFLWISSFIIIACMSMINTSFAQSGLKAQYYDGTNFERLVAERYEANIDQSWLDTPPVPGMNPHECSIRWTGKLKTAKSGTYSFSAQVDDGIRVWIDKELIIDQWDLNDLGLFKGTKELEANREYDLKVEYFNGLIEGEVRLLWKMHKEDPNWYDRLFGDGVEFTVIQPENFLPPKEPIKIAKKEEEKPKAKPKKKPKLKVEKKKKPKTNPQPKPPQPPLPPKNEVRPEPAKPVVSAAMAERYIPKNVQFEKGKTVILASSFKELNAFIRFMKKYPHLKVMVEGHTDVIGDPKLNLELSQDRAKTIFDYLVKEGIASQRITYEGFGSSRPLFVPMPGKYHPENRRVVFVVEGLENDVEE